MKGEDVRKMLKDKGLQLNKIAEIMGETPQNLQSMLRADDIKSGVLERIAQATGENVYYFYKDSSLSHKFSNTTINGNGNANFNSNVSITDDIKELLAIIKTQQEQISMFLSQQQKLIEQQSKLIDKIK